MRRSFPKIQRSFISKNANLVYGNLSFQCTPDGAINKWLYVIGFKIQYSHLTSGAMNWADHLAAASSHDTNKDQLTHVLYRQH